MLRKRGIHTADRLRVIPSVRPHAATGAGPNSYVYDANGIMTVRREVSGTETFVYTQTWSIDNRLIGVTKALKNGAVLAQTSYFYDGDGVRVRKDDPDGTTLYAGPVEQTIGSGGTATAEYFDDISGTSTLTAYVATRSETVAAGLQQTFTAPPAGLGSEPWGVRYQIWLTVPTTDTYRLAVYADDGFLLSGQGLSLSNATPRDVTTTEASTVLTLTPGAIYNFALTYLNYTSATTSGLQLLWRKGGGALEVVPREAIRARGRRDYYSFGGAVVAMKDGVMNAAPRTLSYLHGDHLGSASLSTNASGQKVSEQRYKPYGEVRWTSGAGMPTDFTFTGQRAGSYGTIFMSAREYLPSLGRFLSADSIVPGAGNPQALNRYAYVFNSPLGFVDPDGHTPIWLQRLAGFAFQYVNDMAFGIPSAIWGTDWTDEESVEFQQGQQDGRSMAEIHSAILTVDGLATAAAGAAALPPTGGAVLACAAASVGTCALVGAAPVAAEFGMVVAGTVAAGIGGANLAVMGKNAVRSPNYNFGNFRKNLENRVPIPKGMKDAEAHHMLPQALRARFDKLKLGINIDDPRWGTWWEKSKHQTNSSAWRKAWDDWLDDAKNPTLKQVEDQAAYLASAFGLTWP